MSRFRNLALIGVIAAAGATATVAQERTSPPRPGYGDQIPPGSYQRTCRGANMNGNMLSAQCPNARGAPVFSSIDTNGCRGRDIYNDEGYLRCGSSGPRPPEPPRPVPPRPVPPRPVPLPEPVPGPRPPTRGNYEAILYTRANFGGESLRVAGTARDLSAWPGFNDNVRSIRIVRGRAQVCTDAYFRGRCVTLNRSVRDLNLIGFGNRISSVR